MAYTNSVCPMCGCKDIKFQVRHTGTRGGAGYYRTGVKSSWIIPAGYKTTHSNKRQETICLCPKCGYSWTWLHPAVYAFWINIFPKILFVLLYIGNIAAIGKVNPVFSLTVFIVMTAGLVLWIRKKYKDKKQSIEFDKAMDEIEKDLQNIDTK